MSAIRLLLIFISIGASTAKEGDKFTSISQGFILESMRISNPKTSKQLDRFKLYLKTLSTTYGSIEIMDLIKIS